jgi:hypothetical protein
MNAPNPWRFSGERGRPDRPRRRPAGGIFRPNPVRLLEDSSSTPQMILEPHHSCKCSAEESARMEYNEMAAKRRKKRKMSCVYASFALFCGYSIVPVCSPCCQLLSKWQSESTPLPAGIWRRPGQTGVKPMPLLKPLPNCMQMLCHEWLATNSMFRAVKPSQSESK